MKIVQSIFKWLTLTFFVIAIFAMTIGQALPIEFADWKVMHLFYDIILQGLPIAVLLTLVWTIKKERLKRINITIGVLTPLAAVLVFYYTISTMFSVGFSAWVNWEIIYENRENSSKTINRQMLDSGALCYGPKRIVQLSPILGIWNVVTVVDTSEINKTDWVLVQKQGDMKFP